MFVDPKLRAADAITRAIAEAGGRGADTRRVSTGVFEIGHFSFDTLLSSRGGNLRQEDDWDGYPRDLPSGLPCYGVCDSIEQFMADFAEALQSDSREYCVSFTHIAKEPEPGGWRWHKWGPYIGKGEPTMEYLADEEGFAEGVWVFHIFRRKDPFSIGES